MTARPNLGVPQHVRKTNRAWSYTRPRLTPEQDAEIAAMHARGMTVKAICAATGRSDDTIKRSITRSTAPKLSDFAIGGGE